MDNQLLQKLKINSDVPLLCTDLPESCAPYFEGMALHTKPKKGVVYQQCIFFSLNQAAVDTIPPHFPSLADTAMVWAAYPKAGPLRTDINRDKGWDCFADAGYIAVSQVSIDDTWAALWFRKKALVKKLKRDVPMKDRVTEGIDYIARTATLPQDAVDALKEYDPSLLEMFNSMSFSHKREYVEHIEEAKKPETRLRRIDKVIEVLEAWRDKKKTR